MKWINKSQFIGLNENGRYSGSVAENLDPGADVITVTATDRDEFPDFKKVFTMIPMARMLVFVIRTEVLVSVPDWCNLKWLAGVHLILST